MINFIPILQALISPITEHFENKREDKRYERQIKAEVIKHENERMKWITLNQSKTWKDEALTIWVLIFMTCLFLPWLDPYMDAGIDRLVNLPDWIRTIVIGTFGAGLGINGYNAWKRHQ